MRRPKIKDIRDWIRIKKEFDSYQFIFDVTFGDGFSDIYGKMWNVATNMLKTIAIASKTPFILLPQTYGPYSHPLLKQWAKFIVLHADRAYSRDIESTDYMNKFCGDIVTTLTDMAFLLPYDTNMFSFDSSKKNIGINVSALLWDSEYAKYNKFGLKVDYQTYIKSLIDKLLLDPKVVVHLVPHVIDQNSYSTPENDVRSCVEVKRLYDDSRVLVSPAFTNPMTAKSYISQLDFFIGARMHATIGAVSAGVATMPFAYSKKFETMFGNLQYKYVLDARNVDTASAIEISMKYISEASIIKKAAEIASRNSKCKLTILADELKNLRR